MPEIRQPGMRIPGKVRKSRPVLRLRKRPTMSGPTVNQALQARFDAIRRSELERLKKKLGGLTEEDRRSVEAITADIIQAIASVPAHVLCDEAQPPTLEAVVRLFALEPTDAILG